MENVIFINFDRNFMPGERTMKRNENENEILHPCGSRNFHELCGERSGKSGP